MDNLTVIIPIHNFTKKNIELLNKAVDSVPQELRILVSVPNKTTEKDLSGASKRIQVIQKTDDTSFAGLVNAAVDTLDDGWFSILEFDDTYTNIWYNNFKKYLEFKPDISVFMFMEDIRDFNNGKYVGFGNAEAYASAFSNEIGFLDNDCLQNYFDFYLTGSVFNVKDWKEVGGLKPLLKVTFWYEWMLRATSKGKKIFVIPKVGYIHNMDRKGSYVQQYRSLSNDEIQFYFDLAKRDSFFKDMKEPEKYVFKPREGENEE